MREANVPRVKIDASHFSMHPIRGSTTVMAEQAGQTTVHANMW